MVNLWRKVETGCGCLSPTRDPPSPEAIRAQSDGPRARATGIQAKILAADGIPSRMKNPIASR